LIEVLLRDRIGVQKIREEREARNTWTTRNISDELHSPFNPSRSSNIPSLLSDFLRACVFQKYIFHVWSSSQLVTPLPTSNSKILRKFRRTYIPPTIPLFPFFQSFHLLHLFILFPRSPRSIIAHKYIYGCMYISIQTYDPRKIQYVDMHIMVSQN